MKTRRSLAYLFLAFAAAQAVAQDAVRDSAPEQKGLIADAFPPAGRGDIAECEALAANSARRAVPVATAPPGFMGGWRESSLERERLAKEREFMAACISGKGRARERR